jgi:hypothetical protein
VQVIDCTFTGHRVAAYARGGVVQNSVFVNNDIAVQSSADSTPNMLNCTIAGNRIGVYTTSNACPYGSGNNICGNEWNLYSEGNADCTFNGNYFGSSNMTVVQSRTLDGRYLNAPGGGLLTITPILTGRVPTTKGSQYTCVTTLSATNNYTSDPNKVLVDTVWSLANSPITLTTNVVVFPGAKLTIEPGVQVSAC